MMVKSYQGPIRQFEAIIVLCSAVYLSFSKDSERVTYIGQLVLTVRSSTGHMGMHFTLFWG